LGQTLEFIAQGVRSVDRPNYQSIPFTIIETMDRLTPTSKFDLWKLRTVPLLESKAKKMGLTEPTELLPMALDDTMCTAYSQWLTSHKNPKLTDALDFLGVMDGFQHVGFECGFLLTKMGTW
jgi:hypothetical protein